MMSFRYCGFSVLAFVTSLSPLLAELPSQDGGPPVPVIDMHAHVFNARDLPLKGVLYALGAPRGVAEILAKVLKEWMPADDAAVSSRMMVSAERAPETLAGRIRAKMESNTALLTQRRKVFAGSAKDLLSAQHRQKLRSYVGPKAFIERSTDRDTLDVELVAEALRKIGFPPGETEHVQERLKLFSVDDLLSFVDVLTDPHAQIAWRLRNIEYPQADIFIHHLMDMEKAYNDQPTVRFPKQITQMAALDRAQNGALIHFVAFDPFRRKEALAVASRGFTENAGAIGMKLYPPSGYTASGNKIPGKPPLLRCMARGQWRSRYGGLNGEKLDAINRSFFAHCVRKDIPIFTHCTPTGFEAVKGYGWNCDPGFWRVTLEEFPTLKLCFGHAGGEPYWLAESTLDDSKDDLRRWSFGSNVVQLCLQYSNVFCEVGYFDGILNPEGARQFTSHLGAAINQRSTNGHWAFGDKIMYGTDWHMIHKVAGHTKYLATLGGVFSNSELRPWQRSFFSGNAVRFLNLSDQTNDLRFSEAQRQTWQRTVAKAGSWPRALTTSAGR